MSADPMNVTLRRLSGALFEARNETGQSLLIDGPASVGGAGGGLRPMEACLSALAGCSAVDVLMILQQQRQALGDLEMKVHGERADAVPAVFTRIHVHFAAGGDVEPKKLVRAVDLSMDKYCSVAKMLVAGGVQITHGVSRIVSPASATPGARVRVTGDAAEAGRALAALGHGALGEGGTWLVAERGNQAIGLARIDAASGEFTVIALREPEAAAALEEVARSEQARARP